MSAMTTGGGVAKNMVVQYTNINVVVIMSATNCIFFFLFLRIHLETTDSFLGCCNSKYDLKTKAKRTKKRN